MRDELAKWEGERRTFEATFKHAGLKPGPFGGYAMTVLLIDVVDVATGEPVTDHVWMNATKGFLALSQGERVRFRATITAYYSSGGDNYGLKYPRNVRRVPQREKTA